MDSKVFEVITPIRDWAKLNWEKPSMFLGTHSMYKFTTLDQVQIWDKLREFGFLETADFQIKTFMRSPKK